MTTPGNSTVTRRELRQFGIGLAILGGAGGGLLLWNGRMGGVLAVLAGLLLGAAFWCELPGFRRIYTGWMALAGVMGHVMTRVLLTLLFLLVLTPIALIGRACGQRFVERGFRSAENSYWSRRSATQDRSSCEKQS